MASHRVQIPRHPRFSSSPSSSRTPSFFVHKLRDQWHCGNCLTTTLMVNIEYLTILRARELHRRVSLLVSNTFLEFLEQVRLRAAGVPLGDVVVACYQPGRDRSPETVTLAPHQNYHFKSTRSDRPPGFNTEYSTIKLHSYKAEHPLPNGMTKVQVSKVTRRRSRAKFLTCIPAWSRSF